MATLPNFQSIDSVLDAQTAQLKAMTERAKALLRIQAALRTLLPAPMREQCSVGQWEDGELAVYAANGAVATRIKQQVPSYCEKLTQRGFDIRTMRVKVAPQWVATPTAGAKPPIPASAIAQFSALSESMEAGPLKSAIQALVKRQTG